MNKLPNSCIKCGRAIFSDDYHTCDSCALTTHAGAAAAEPSDAVVAEFVERTVGLWREYDRADVLKLAKAALTSAPAVPEADALRAEGWAVAVHNDYKLQGVPYTFWLFTKDGRAIKGEGQSDAEALAEVRAALKGVQPGERGEG